MRSVASPSRRVISQANKSSTLESFAQLVQLIYYSSEALVCHLQLSFHCMSMLASIPKRNMLVTVRESLSPCEGVYVFTFYRQMFARQML